MQFQKKEKHIRSVWERSPKIKISDQFFVRSERFRRGILSLDAANNEMWSRCLLFAASALRTKEISRSYKSWNFLFSGFKKDWSFGATKRFLLIVRDTSTKFLRSWLNENILYFMPAQFGSGYSFVPKNVSILAPFILRTPFQPDMKRSYNCTQISTWLIELKFEPGLETLT